MIHDVLDDNNFMFFAAKHYDNPQCYDVEEFYDDIKRFKYLKRLFSKYHESGELRENLILNHIIILYNVFGDAATKMLFFKLVGYYPYLKPFLVTIGRMPETLVGIGFNTSVIRGSDIPEDSKIVEVLKNIQDRRN